MVYQMTSIEICKEQYDEVVSAGEFMKSIDEELEGIDSVLTCAYG